MTTFTITITPDDEHLATTSIRVDATVSTVLITQLLITAATGTGLMATQLPAVNLDLLLQAVTPAVLTTPAATPATSAPVATAAPAASIAAKTTRPQAPRKQATPIAAADPAAPATKPGNRTAGQSKALGDTAKSKPRAAAGKKSSGPEVAPETSGTTGRTYRRMPQDLPAVFAQAGSVTGVADHYDVPRHTAQNWIGRARKQGTIPTR